MNSQFRNALSPSEAVKRALKLAPVVRKGLTPSYAVVWTVEKERFATYGPARRYRFRRALALATGFCHGGLESLVEFPNAMPKVMREIALAEYRKRTGQPRRTGWKWSETSRARLSAVKTRKPSPPKGHGKTPHVYFDSRGELQIPDGETLAISRETLLRILCP